MQEENKSLFLRAMDLSIALAHSSGRREGLSCAKKKRDGVKEFSNRILNRP